MFPDLREELVDAVDEVFSEAIRHLPLLKGLSDPGRPPADFAAVLRTGGREGAGAGMGRGTKLRPEVMASGGELRIDHLAYSALILKAGDRIMALDRVGQPIFEILDIDDRSHLRRICRLGDV